MDHDAAIAQRPALSAGGLIACEAVFGGDDVIGEFVLVEDVAEAGVEVIVLVVRHFHDSVFHAERVAEVIAQRIAGDLRRPAGEVFSVE